LDEKREFAQIISVTCTNSKTSKNEKNIHEVVNTLLKDFLRQEISDLKQLETPSKSQNE